ncbi:spore cortex biosynthesis protein YabQ [Paenibacillus wynnii]|uniref:Spore cortex biosynthesis protein YabQ n=1 Tax=Paenibacillus wynnii TaxID=268407 RepID=A0A098MD83_9BACL|nr:spore cortex biosynthesis protein YabQ [Paenibacillus wynnii]KGE19936.1 spore cortex biosynthesis protein YabQ [Paenibacillus wynnii]
MNPVVQWVTLLYMLLAGSVMGLAYDSYRVISVKLHFSKGLNAALDLLYWMAAALFVFRMLYAGNQGQLRFYAFLGLFLGVWIYFLIFSVTVRRFVVMLIQSVQYVCSLVWRLIVIVIGLPLLWLWNLFVGILRLLGRMFLSVLKILRWLTKPLWVLPARWISAWLLWLKARSWVVKGSKWLTKIWRR